MKGNKILYAAVGAPVIAARKVGEKVESIRTSLSKETDTLSESASKQVDAWAEEGEKVVARISDGKMVDELAAKVDFDQMQEQVSKLRDQLEDMLATWRASFRPEKVKEATGKVSHESTESVKATPSKKPAAKKTTAKKSTGTSTTGKSTTGRSTTGKSTTAKKATAAPKAAQKAS